MKVLGFVVGAIVFALTALVTVLSVWRPGLADYAAHTTTRASGGLTATWFGVTAVLLSDGEHSVFIDPFFTRPPGLLNLVLDRAIAPDEPLIASWLARAGVEKLDAVLVSHSHYDHGMDAGVVARLTGAQLIGSPSTLNIGRSDGVPEDALLSMIPGVTQQIGPWRITFIESRHAGATGGAPIGDIKTRLPTPRHYLDYKLGGAYSILIEHAQGRVLHHGSAGFIPGALKGVQADTVLLGVAFIDDLPTYLSEVVDAVGAQRLVPVHWDDFTRPLDQPLKPMPVVVRLDRFFERVPELRPELELLAPQLGVPFKP